jgi:hypothetical protein
VLGRVRRDHGARSVVVVGRGRPRRRDDDRVSRIPFAFHECSGAAPVVVVAGVRLAYPDSRRDDDDEERRCRDDPPAVPEGEQADGGCERDRGRDHDRVLGHEDRLDPRHAESQSERQAPPAREKGEAPAVDGIRAQSQHDQTADACGRESEIAPGRVVEHLPHSADGRWVDPLDLSPCRRGREVQRRKDQGGERDARLDDAAHGGAHLQLDEIRALAHLRPPDQPGEAVPGALDLLRIERLVEPERLAVERDQPEGRREQPDEDGGRPDTCVLDDGRRRNGGDDGLAHRADPSVRAEEPTVTG